MSNNCEPAVVLEFYCLFFRTSWCVGILNSAIFNSFHNRVEFGTILEGLRNFGGGGMFEPPPLSVHHWSGPAILHMLLASVLRTVINAFKGTINLKSLYPGQQLGSGPLRVCSGPSEKMFLPTFPPPIHQQPAKNLYINSGDWLSVAEWLGFGLKRWIYTIDK